MRNFYKNYSKHSDIFAMKINIYKYLISKDFFDNMSIKLSIKANERKKKKKTDHIRRYLIL